VVSVINGASIEADFISIFVISFVVRLVLDVKSCNKLLYSDILLLYIVYH
jgi:hypothetical protein